MVEKQIGKAALLMASIVLVTLLCCEWYLRSRGYPVAFDEGGALFSHQRAMVYEPSDRTVVFCGSSRIKFDLSHAVWEKMTGAKAVQLACVGSSPRPILEDLGNDPNFKGRLIVDVTEGLFFSNRAGNMKTPTAYLKYYQERTPAQWASFQINRVVESQLVFIDEERFALNARLDALDIPSRKGVNNPAIFPLDMGWTSFDREDFMLDRMVGDTVQENQVKNIWNTFSARSKAVPVSGDELTAMLQTIKDATDKIKSRGGEVVFVRTPSNGTNLQRELKNYPREKYWDRLLAFTGCKGYHYTDYQPIDKLVCPENSHLSPEGAKTYTKRLVEILETEQHWKFPSTKL